MRPAHVYAKVAPDVLHALHMPSHIFVLMDLAEGNIDLAIESLRDAADVEEALPYSYGPPEIVKPAAELLGEVLVEEGDAEGAREAFARALTRAPGRRLSERGVPDEKRAQGDDETF